MLHPPRQQKEHQDHQMIVGVDQTVNIDRTTTDSSHNKILAFVALKKTGSGVIRL